MTPLEERLQALEIAVDGLIQRLHALEGKGKPVEKGEAVQRLAAPASALPPPVLAPVPVQEPPRTVLPSVPAPPTEPKPDFEWRVGATWLNRLGAAAILLAVAFFVSYSFKQGWITPAMRCLAGGVFSIAFLGWGEWLRRHGQRGFSQGITGCGIAVAYVSAYAAHAFYGLIGVPAAFGLMTVATAASLLVAAWADAQAVAVLGYLGGVVTPILLSTGKDALAALLPYLLTLSVGAVFQGRKRSWSLVRWVSWVGAAVLMTGWAMQFLNPANRLVFSLGILTLAFLFQGDALTRIGRPDSGTGDAVLLALNAALATGGIYLAWDRAFPQWMGTLAMVGAVVQAWSGWQGWRRQASSPAAWALITHAAALIAVAVPLQFDGKGVALGWAAQVLVSAWAARQYGQKWLSLHAAATALLAVGHLAVFESFELSRAVPLAAFGPWALTTPLAASLGVAGASLVAAWVLGALVPRTAHLLAGLSTVVALAFLFLDFPKFAGTLPGWAWAGLLFTAAVARWEGLRRHAWIAAGLLLAKFWIVDILVLDGWQALAVSQAPLNLRSFCTALSAAVFLFAGLKGGSATRSAAMLLGVLCLLGGASLEIHRLFLGAVPEPPRLGFGEVFVTTALWAAGAMGLGWLCGLHPGLRVAAWTMGALMTVKFWISDVMFRGGWEAMTVSRSLASPRTVAALAVAGMLLGLACSDKQAPPWRRGLALALSALSLLGWVSLEIHRAFIGTAMEPLHLSDAEQIAHSGAWALGAMLAVALGMMRDLKSVRIAGLAGIGLVAMKILLLDLADVASIYRVGILFVLGVLSLAGSWAYHKRGKGTA